MSPPRSPFTLIKSAAAPALAILVIVHFAGFALFGQNGLFAWGDYKRAAVRKQTQLHMVEVERNRLAHRVSLLNPHKVDPDYADELVRRETGQVRPDEVIIPVN